MAKDAPSLVWKALADPTRRKILDGLREHPRTTNQVCAAFSISRIGVMKHLQVLTAAGLVISRKRGRERWHYLNAAPLMQIQRRWMQQYEALWASQLLNLKDLFELEEGEMAGGAGVSLQRCLDVQLDVEIAAPAARVYGALVGEPAAWWGPPYLNPGTTDLRIEEHLGGRFYEVWGEAGGALLAVVTVLLPPKRLHLTGPFHLGLAHGVAKFELEEAAGSTVLRFSHGAFGELPEGKAAEWERGWGELLGTRLKAFVERGERGGIR